MIHHELSTLANGTTIDHRFQLEELLGRGATGTVFRARDLLMDGTEVALKVLHQHIAADARSLARFKKEVLVARSLQHPGVVETYELRLLGEALSFVVMEYVPGTSLEERISAAAHEPLQLTESLTILVDIAAALAHAHSQGVIHRDLKPANVLLGHNGQARLVDFGLARLLEDEQGLTRTGESLGTPHYMSPEQFRGLKASKASDVYSFGVLAFELLTGRRPFAGDSYYAVAISHLTDPLPLDELQTSGTPEWLQQLIVVATEKTPEHRKLSMHAIHKILAAELAKLTGPTAERPKNESIRPKTPYHRRDTRDRRHRLLISLAIPSLLTVAFIAGVRFFDGGTYAALVAPVLRLEQKIGFKLTPLRIIAGVDLDLSDDKRMYEYIVKSIDDKKSLVAARTLLKAGFNPNAVFQGESLFLKACETGDWTLLSFFIAAGVDPNTKDSNTGRRCVHKAALMGDMFRVAQIYDLDCDATAQDHAGDTFLHVWSRMGPTEAFRSDTGEWMRTALKIRNNAGFTPLHLALREPVDVNKVKTLLDLGADPHELLPDQQTALALAESSGNEVVIALIREAQARSR